MIFDDRYVRDLCCCCCSVEKGLDLIMITLDLFRLDKHALFDFLAYIWRSAWRTITDMHDLLDLLLLFVHPICLVGCG